MNCRLLIRDNGLLLFVSDTHMDYYYYEYIIAVFSILPITSGEMISQSCAGVQVCRCDPDRFIINF